MNKRPLPYNIYYHDGDQELTLELLENPTTLSGEEADSLAYNLVSFVYDIEEASKPKNPPKPSAEGADI